MVDVLASIGVFDCSSYMSRSLSRKVCATLMISKLTYRDSGIMVLNMIMNETMIGL